MSGSSIAVASRAVESRTMSPFHASHPPPQPQNRPVLTGRALPKPPPSASSLDAAPVDHSPGFKSLPPLPGLAAFDIPSFDLVSEFERSFSFSSASSETTANAVVAALAEKHKTTTTITTIAIPQRPATAVDRTVQVDFTGQNEAVGETVTGSTVVGGHARNRSRSMVDRPLSWLPGSKTAPSVVVTEEQSPKRLAKQNVAASQNGTTPAGKPLERSRTVESFADFARRSWISKSRSPSPPSSKPDKSRGTAGRTLFAESSATTPANTVTAADAPSGKKSALNRASIYLTRIKQKPQAVFSRNSASTTNKAPAEGGQATSDSESVTPTPSSLSLPSPVLPTKNASYNSVSSSTSRASSQAPSVDTEADTDTATASSTSEIASHSTVETNLTMPHPTSRDPLWATYRTLDLEFSKFASKGSTTGRMSVVRAILVPFLRSTAYHPSNSNRSILAAEDVDRRATILNKWWNGLLAMLIGANSRLPSGFGQGMAALGVNFPVLQPVAGVDRPILLEATTMIMMRPEWRACTSQYQPLDERCSQERVRPRSGTRSSVDTDPDSLLAESAEHNIRTMFVANLTTQMALVVDKLSLRHAPMSLVNWCGKACAYAFFFVPGVSDVLVRLWGLNADLLRRVADEFGLPRRSKGESDDIVALFPSHMHKLGWSSVKSLGDKLRVAAKLPLLLAKIHWHGPWMSRWRGGDTDLVFIFCKYFYILSQDFMPEGLPLVEKARSPAFVLVHAQLLSILDSTICRQASLDALLGPPLSDTLHGADAALTAPQLPSNLMKGMDENRLIVLLRDMLSDKAFGVFQEVKQTFAEAFLAVTKAAAKRTPRFEHASCFMLCDFLEEALLALDTFQTTVNTSIATSPMEGSEPSDYFTTPSSPTKAIDCVDWPFWFDVGKIIMDSNNTMSEIRILSFLYSMWDSITADPARKEAVCLDWLLSDEIFAKFFSHWCPMVRAYYMRLLCWRICRDAGSSNEVDVKIFLVVSQRLRTVWSHYLWLRQDAELKKRVHPSTAPAYPAPGKRFLIIRSEVHPPQPSHRLGFDSSGTFPPLDSFDHIVPTQVNNDDSSPEKEKADANLSFKKRWSLLGKVLPFGPMQEGPKETKRTWEEELEQARRDTAASRLTARGGKWNASHLSAPPTPPKQGPSGGVTPSSNSVSSVGSVPTFDATTFVFRFTLTWQAGPGGGPMPCPPSRDRIITRPRLPAPAQSRVSVRTAGQTNVSATNGSLPCRSDSPPPLSPGMPPETRRVSGLLHTGLISEARNARPLSMIDNGPRKSLTKDSEKRLSLSINIAPLRLENDHDNAGDAEKGSDGRSVQSPASIVEFSGLDTDSTTPLPLPAPAVLAERPTGVYAPAAVYAGRALAEWALVVSECNNFVDRRRDEGVLGLSDVEVPTLSVDGLGMRARG